MFTSNVNRKTFALGADCMLSNIHESFLIPSLSASLDFVLNSMRSQSSSFISLCIVV